MAQCVLYKPGLACYHAISGHVETRTWTGQCSLQVRQVTGEITGRLQRTCQHITVGTLKLQNMEIQDKKYHEKCKGR